MMLVIALFFILLTVAFYICAQLIHRRFTYVLTIPVIPAMIMLVFTLTLSDISYESYMIGGKWIEFWLGPAVVALAVPLYRQWGMLKKYLLPLLLAVLTGTIIGVASGYVFMRMAGFRADLLYAMLPKSVTTPVAVDVANVLDGNPSLAALFVMIAGISGVLLTQLTWKLFRIHHPLSKGIGLGCAAHALGTAKAITDGELEGAASSVAMTLCAVILSLLTPLILLLL
ncbi:putative murein hydrolase (TIGR00659 family) [Geomicrobium halophilum]|uniref:Putative murein hydrolase (TIGR00659 family) n=1 Tax=Geomicrobium halophilum TaxID=549000 RepID=A0A841PLL8_9BACL|nr:LrgB family protein [Geomicrobium halophilum]MBB6448106.1 putative murein hydrolase (TIGR00659 family) [Geomicrobium halophilum]